MKVIKGNIWDYPGKDHGIVIPTNGYIKRDGSCIMGKGLSLQAKERIPGIEFRLGRLIRERGNNVFYLGKGLLSFPVKDQWWEKAKLSLIMKSAIQLKELVDTFVPTKKIVLPKVGCGNGGLNWIKVEPILDDYLDDRFIIVDLL